MQRQHSYNTGRIRRSDTLREGELALRQAQGAAPRGARPGSKTKKKGKRKGLLIFLSIMLVLVSGLTVAGGMLLSYLRNDILDPGDLGVAASENYTPPEWKGKVLNILILGIDNEDGRGYGAGLGLTDMVMFVQFDLLQGTMHFLQVPRDAFVGYSGAAYGSDGRINAVLLNGPDKENPINNVFSIFHEQFKLPVDRYIAMDMDALREIVDAFRGILVYVPQDMDDGEGSRLSAGLQWLDGEQTEFFVRNRHGNGFVRGDIDRLDNQRYFYSALFRRFMTMTARDIVKLTPVFNMYCNTNFTVDELMSLGMSVLKLDASKVMFCKAPGANGVNGEKEEWPGAVTGDPEHYIIDVYGRGTEEEPGLAQLLNLYFRAYDESAPYDASALGFPNISIPGHVPLYSPNIRFMDNVQEEEGGEDIDVEPR